jgi:glucokinase
MTPRSDTALAIDLGGTRIKAGLVVSHQIVAQRTVPTGDEQGFDHVLENLFLLCEELLREQPAKAIGFCLPGVVDVERGTLVDVRKNLLGLIAFPIVDVFQQRYGIPVAIDNDARLYGLGEMAAGAAREVENFVCLTLGTGVGCCVAMDGYILRGRHGTGGVLGGHVSIDAHGPLCTCGNVGCVETRCSASALGALMRDLLSRQAPPRDDPALTPEMITAAAAKGDTVAAAALAEYAHYLSVAAVSYIHAYDADLVVLGGGVISAADQIVPPVQRYVAEHAWRCPPRVVPIRAAVLGDSAGLVGAAALARGLGRFR